MLRKPVRRFSEVFVTDHGYQVRVEMQDAPDISQEASFRPRRIAAVAKSSLVHAGTVIQGQGTAYLLVDQVTLGQMMRFRAYEITDWLHWQGLVKVTDLVTGLPKSTSKMTKQASLPVVVEPVRTVQEFGVEKVKYYIYTGSDVEIGDTVGPYQVHNVTHILGVRRLEVM